MKYETRIVNSEKGIIQITTEDERFYSRQINGKTIFVPSITWICECYPKGIGFYKWLANHGWDEAEALKEAAGERGSYIHNACHALMQGKTIQYNTIVDDRELITEEYAGVMSFVGWYNENKPIVEKSEYTVFSPDNRYAGTLDLLCKIKGETWIIDFKTSQNIWPSFMLQVSAYKHALGIDAKLGILQLGYKRNQKGWKFTEVEDSMELFNAAYLIWQQENAKVQPLQKDYPLELKLNMEVKNETANKK